MAKKSKSKVDTYKVLYNVIIPRTEIETTIVDHKGEIYCLIQGYRIYYKPFTALYALLYGGLELSLKYIQEMEQLLQNSKMNNKFLNNPSDLLNNTLYADKEKYLNGLNTLLKYKDKIATPEELNIIIPDNLRRTYRNLSEQQSQLIKYTSNIFKNEDTKVPKQPLSILHYAIENCLPVLYTDNDKSDEQKATIDEIYDLIGLPENIKKPDKYDSLCNIFTCMSEQACPDNLTCLIDYNRFYNLMTKSKEYKLNPTFNHNLTVLIKVQENYSPLIINCVKLNNNPSFDYEVTVILVSNVPSKSPTTKNKFRNPNISYDRHIHYFYNSKTNEIYVRCLGCCKRYCDNYKDSINIELLDYKGEKDKNTKGYCNKFNCCYLSKFVFNPENFINVLGYIQYILENRHHTSKLKNYNRSDSYDNGLGVKIRNFHKSETTSPDSENLIWVTVKEYHTKEKELNKVGSIHTIHKSPCEHYRASHQRVLKSGKIVQVRSSIVNKGKNPQKAIYDIK